MTSGFAYKLRGYRDETCNSEEIGVLTHNLRREYLSIQAMDSHKTTIRTKRSWNSKEKKRNIKTNL